VGPFDQVAVGEAGFSADEGDEVGRVHRTWAASTSLNAIAHDATLTANARPQGGLLIEIHVPLIPFAMPR
jgi:hypothetical protein